MVFSRNTSVFSTYKTDCNDIRYKLNTTIQLLNIERDQYEVLWSRVQYCCTLLHKTSYLLSFIFPVPACYKCFIILNETKKAQICKILLANIFKSIGTLSQIFEYDIYFTEYDFCPM